MSEILGDNGLSRRDALKRFGLAGEALLLGMNPLPASSEQGGIVMPGELAVLSSGDTDAPKGGSGAEGPTAIYLTSSKVAQFFEPNARYSKLDLRRTFTESPLKAADEMFAVWVREMRDRDTWYIPVVDDIRRLASSGLLTPDVRAHIDEFVEERLILDQVKMGNVVHNWDKLRRPIDTLVLHHSAGSDDVSKWRFSVWGLTNIYAPDYRDNQRINDPEGDKDRDFLGEDITDEPIETDHFMTMLTRRRSGLVEVRRQVAPSYHWAVNSNGEILNLLEESHLGFHALGGINGRSVAVALNGDYSGNRIPDRRVLEAVSDIYLEYRDRIGIERILGHKEVPGNNTECPGGAFSEWKQVLLAMIQSRLPQKSFISTPT